jgi:hypothetical protein
MRFKSRILPVLICLIPALLSAQIISGFGFKTAFTRSKLAIEDFTDFTTWRSGFNVALCLERDVCKFFSVAPQFEYVQKGYASEQVETTETGTEVQTVRANTRLDHLSLPLFLKSNIRPGN